LPTLPKRFNLTSTATPHRNYCSACERLLRPRPLLCSSHFSRAIDVVFQPLFLPFLIVNSNGTFSVTIGSFGTNSASQLILQNILRFPFPPPLQCVIFVPYPGTSEIAKSNQPSATLSGDRPQQADLIVVVFLVFHLRTGVDDDIIPLWFRIERSPTVVFAIETDAVEEKAVLLPFVTKFAFRIEVFGNWINVFRSELRESFGILTIFSPITCQGISRFR
jgi:hypothetical protein